MTSGQSIELRLGRLEDADALAQLHVEVWRETYAHLAPAEAYHTLDAVKRLPYWQEALASNDPLTGVVVATDGATNFGVISFGRSSKPEMSDAIEIKHCYVRSVARGSGLGKRLMTAAFDALRSQGCNSVMLAVVRENTEARRFYAAMGGREIGRFTDPGPLWRSSNCLVAWTLGE